MSTRIRCGLNCCRMAASALILLVAGIGVAMAQTTPLSPSAATQIAAPPSTAPPVAALAPGGGLCQCIADHQRLDFMCPGSAEGCKSACGAHYSFKPDAECRTTGNP